LEALEDRLTPSLDFFPVAHVAINPDPLPPTALVEFDPLPNLATATAGMSTQQEHLIGVLSKQIGMPGVVEPCWILEAFYSLNASVTENDIPPSPFAAGSISDTFSLTGTETVALIPVAPTTGPTWVFSGTLSENGTFNGVISPPDPATGISQLSSTFTQTGMQTGTWIDLGAPVLSAPDGREYHAVFQSAGMLGELPLAPTVMPSPPTANFRQQDQVTACFMPAPSPFHPPGPCITVNAAFATWGSVTFNSVPVVFPGSNGFIGQNDGSIQQITGSEQYTDQGVETILMPDGSTLTIPLTAIDTGSFTALTTQDVGEVNGDY
jgi:hypothetical protein